MVVCKHKHLGISMLLPAKLGEHVRVNGWPLLVVVEGVTREFFRSRSSPLVLEASDLRLPTTGPRTRKH